MAIAFQDYYETLGVSRQATQAEIQKAFRKLARQYHPDVNKDKGAEDKFKKMNEAYEVLKNPSSRKKYDQLGNHWRSGEPFSPPKSGAQDFNFDFGNAFSGTGFSSFFDMLFGSQGKRPTSSPFQNEEDESSIEQEATIEVSLEESLHGVEKELLVRAMNGEQRHINVRIPPGAIEGSKIRLKGQGRSKTRGGRPGDLVLKIKLKPDPQFRVEKHDLVSTLKISPWEAVLGAKVSVATLAKPVAITIPPGTQSGQRLRLKGKGLPRPKGEPGDIFYEVEVVVPKILTTEERQHFEALARISHFAPRG